MAMIETDAEWRDRDHAYQRDDMTDYAGLYVERCTDCHGWLPHPAWYCDEMTGRISR